MPARAAERTAASTEPRYHPAAGVPYRFVARWAETLRGVASDAAPRAYSGTRDVVVVVGGAETLLMLMSNTRTEPAGIRLFAVVLFP